VSVRVSFKSEEWSNCGVHQISIWGQGVWVSVRLGLRSGEWSNCGVHQISLYGSMGGHRSFGGALVEPGL